MSPLRFRLAAAACLLPLAAALAQAPPQADFAEGWVQADAVLTLRIGAERQARWRQWRWFVGTLEVTALARLAAPGVIELVPAGRWAAGEAELHIHDGEGEPLVLPLRVLGAGGYEKHTLKPRLDLQSEGRGAERRSDGQPASPRGRHADQGGSAGLAWQGQRGGWTHELAANTVGHSHREKALQFAQRGAAAAKVDLADWRLALQREDGLAVEAGHLSAGTHPLLAQSFASRGLGLRGKFGAHTELSWHGLRSRPVVGWEDPLGLREADERLQVLALATELVGERPGALRAELSLLEGRRSAEPGFGEAAVTDAERSRGAGLRLLGASVSGNWRGELALARSRIDSPFDPLLAQGGELQAPAPATADASHAMLQWQALQQVMLGGHGFDLTLELRHDRTEAAFRSLAAAPEPDRVASRAGLQAAWHGATAQLQLVRGHDNLARVASVLQTRSDEHTLALALPLPAWGGLPQALPALVLNLKQAHQRAINTPAVEDSGIAATHRPDQRSSEQQADLNWTFGSTTLAWTLVNAHIDNRQIGRERADFRRREQRLALQAAFGEAWRVGLRASVGRQHGIETGLVGRSTGGGLQIDWQAGERWTLAALLQHDRIRDSQGRNRSDDSAAQLQISHRFGVPGIDKPLSAQVFLRLGAQAQRQRDTVFGTAADWRSGWLDAGLSLSFF